MERVTATQMALMISLATELRAFRRPEFEFAMLRGVDKVLVGGQESDVMPDAELGDERVDGGDLNARSSTGVAQGGSSNMVLSIWLY